MSSTDKSATAWLRAVVPSDAYFAYGLPDEELGERLVWFVEQTPDDKQIQCFREHLSQLPPYHRPKSICVSSSFILSPSSKVDRKATAQQPFKADSFLGIDSSAIFSVFFVCFGACYIKNVYLS